MKGENKHKKNQNQLKQSALTETINNEVLNSTLDK